jgi:hypothetical protein
LTRTIKRTKNKTESYKGNKNNFRDFDFT